MNSKFIYFQIKNFHFYFNSIKNNKIKNQNTIRINFLFIN